MALGIIECLRKKAMEKGLQVTHIDQLEKDLTTFTKDAEKNAYIDNFIKSKNLELDADVRRTQNLLKNQQELVELAKNPDKLVIKKRFLERVNDNTGARKAALGKDLKYYPKYTHKWASTNSDLIQPDSEIAGALHGATPSTTEAADAMHDIILTNQRIHQMKVDAGMPVSPNPNFNVVRPYIQDWKIAQVKDGLALKNMVDGVVNKEAFAADIAPLRNLFKSEGDMWEAIRNAMVYGARPLDTDLTAGRVTEIFLDALNAKDASSQVFLSKQFGTGSIMKDHLEGLERNVREIARTQLLGRSPAEAKQLAKSILQQLQKDKAYPPAELKSLEDNLLSSIDYEFGGYSRTILNEGLPSYVGAAVKDLQTLASAVKATGATIPNMFQDLVPAVAGNKMYHVNGQSFALQASDYLTAFFHPKATLQDAADAAHMGDMMFRGFNQNFTTAKTLFGNGFQKYRNFIGHLTGYDSATLAQRVVATKDMIANSNKWLHVNYNQVDPIDKTFLNRAGIFADDWAHLQKSAKTDIEGVLEVNVDKMLNDGSLKDREVALKYLQMLHLFREIKNPNEFPELGKLKAGINDRSPVLGLFLRNYLTFTSYVARATQEFQARPLQMMDLLKGLSYAGGTTAGLIFAGMLGYQAKRVLVEGKQPYSLDDPRLLYKSALSGLLVVGNAVSETGLGQTYYQKNIYDVVGGVPGSDLVAIASDIAYNGKLFYQGKPTHMARSMFEKVGSATLPRIPAVYPLFMRTVWNPFLAFLDPAGMAKKTARQQKVDAQHGTGAILGD